MAFGFFFFFADTSPLSSFIFLQCSRRDAIRPFCYLFGHTRLLRFVSLLLFFPRNFLASDTVVVGHWRVSNFRPLTVIPTYFAFKCLTQDTIVDERTIVPKRILLLRLICFTSVVPYRSVHGDTVSDPCTNLIHFIFLRLPLVTRIDRRATLRTQV